MKIDTAGNYFLAGRIQVETGGNKPILMKLDADGNELWQKDYNLLDQSDLIPNIGFVDLLLSDHADTWYAIQTYPNLGCCLNEIGLVLLNSEGETNWFKTIPADDVNAELTFIDAQLDAQENIYLLYRQANSNPASARMGLISYSKSGELRWQREEIGLRTLEPNDLTIYADSLIFVGAQTKSTSTAFNQALLKFDTSGRRYWINQNFQPETEDICTSIDVDSSGQVWMSGFRLSDDSITNVATKYDIDGQIIEHFQESATATSSDEWQTIRIQPDQHPIIAGSRYFAEQVEGVDHAFNDDFYVFKLDSAAKPVWTQLLSGKGTGSVVPRLGISDPKGNIYIVADRKIRITRADQSGADGQGLLLLK